MPISRNVTGASLFLMMISLVTPRAADADIISNGSFETGFAPGSALNLPPGSTLIDNWTVVTDQVFYVGGLWVASDQVRSVGLRCGGGISQTFATQAGQDYEVRFDMAGAPGAPVVKNMSLSAGGTPAMFSFDTTGHDNFNMGWTEKVWVFTASGAATTLTFQSLTSGCAGPAIDNVRVTPFPSALPPAMILTLTGCTTCQPGNQFTVQAHLTNPGPSVSVELKVGFRLPNGLPANLLGQHLVVTLPAGVDVTFPLLNFAWPAAPTGNWTIESTMLEPALGALFSRSVAPFTASP